MVSIQAFGHYLPDRILNNTDLARLLGCDPEWIFESSGIEERRIAAEDETIAAMAERASRQCLERAGTEPLQIGLVILSSATSERRFPGPAAQLAQRLGLAGVPALDLPVASAGSLFGLALASQLAPVYGTVLVAAAEKMSGSASSGPLDRNVAILFGDGAGASLVSRAPGAFDIVDAVLHSDGIYADDLCLPLSGPLHMDGRTVILQASRRIPAAVRELLERNGADPAAIHTFLLHQANSNLTARVAKTLGISVGRFFSNIRYCGNTSSASLLIAASQWAENAVPEPGNDICFAAFGAGFHWGALLARKS
jgi:3-oxoacyl-[acyl-carrier-protein] synthase III